MRGAGVGDGDGDGVGRAGGPWSGGGVGVGVCAIALSGSWVAANPATPSVGINLTNDLRLAEVFFVFFLFATEVLLREKKVRYLFTGTIVPVPTPWVLSAPYFNWTTFALPNR